MKLSLKAGTTSKTVNVFIQDSSSTTGAGLTGLVFNSAGLVAYYALPRAAAVAITLATLAAVTSAYSSGGFKEIDATNMPGWYRLDIPDAALAASNAFSSIHLKGATNMAPLPIEIELTATDNQSATAFMASVASVTGSVGSVAGAVGSVTGFTASDVGAIKTKTDFLPSATAGAAGGLFIAGTNAATAITTGLTAHIIGTVDTLTTYTGNTLQTADVAARTPAALTANGNMKSSMVEILTTALTETAGLLAGGFKKFFNVATPTGTVNSLADAVPGAAGGGFIAGTNAATTVTTALTTTFTGNLTGSVGSVTGAVGSVTGNVGGNVVGSVASVTADVGITQAAADKVFGISGAALTEVAQGAPSATPRPDQALMLLYMALRNNSQSTATARKILNNAGTTICKGTMADDGTTFTQGQLVTGP